MRKLAYTNDNVKKNFNCSSQFLQSGPYSSLCLKQGSGDKILNSFGVTTDIVMHLLAETASVALILIKGKVIIERNRLIIDVFQCMFAHCF